MTYLHIDTILEPVLKSLQTASSVEEIDSIKVQFMGKKGPLTAILKEISSLPAEQRPAAGQEVNAAKASFLTLFQERRQHLETLSMEQHLSNSSVDVSLPSFGTPLGHLHPLTQTLQDITAIFKRLGFSVASGPDIESDAYNFEKLNIPAHHPSRDMHDTFYFSDSFLLRTHTSPVQIRSMLASKPPLRILAPGKVYRCDSDATHSAMFHQLEGLWVDKEITFADLKGLLSYFLQELFGSEKKVRFRPSYFPFTEPSTEVDVECVMCNGSGCRLCKQSGWLEILGAGMVHPNVFAEVNYNIEDYRGFAFGLGIDRIAMLRYKIDDIRLLYENDVRFLSQF